MHVELVRTVTRDGLRLDGALTPARHASADDSASPVVSAAILLHGVASNFYTSSTFEPLIGRLNEIGFAALSVNTRGHDLVFGASLGTVRRRLGASYETVDDCRLDIAAWIGFLKSRGHERIALIGHSLGAVKAVYATVQEKFAEVVAVVAISPPRLSYSAFMNAADSSQFWESINTAQQMAKAGQGEELFTSTFPFPLLVTAAAYIDKYGPAERYNILKFAADLPCPALFAYGGKELTSGGIPFAGVPEALQSLHSAERRSIEVIDRADHVYTGVSAKLADTVATWLQRQ
ncbi:MAG TPA: alpha/beta fold hydrolase [Pirellulaceae bacterium]|jgi:pimeloyl-ACP methyl ester carboxylesterase